MANLGDSHMVPVYAVDSLRQILMKAHVPIGASGAVGTVTGSPGISAVRASTGSYTITYPKCADSVVVPILRRATMDDKYVEMDTNTPTSGSATVECWDVSGVAVTDPASGSVIDIIIMGEAG